MQTQPAADWQIVSIVLGFFSLLAAVASPWLAARWSAAKFEGSVGARLNGHDKAVADLEIEQDNQWKYIHDTREQVAKVKGRLGINGDSALPPIPQRRRVPAGGD
jgi:hypothetical protein